MKTKVLGAILFLILSGAAFGGPSKRLPFINDDYEKARVEANRRNVPLFVEVWAPW